MKNILKNQSGVTLLEMMVAISIFAAMMVAVTGLFRVVNDSQRAAVSSKNTQESLRFILEVVSKEIRQARIAEDACDATFGITAANEIFNTNAGNDRLYFQNKHGECVSYYISDACLVVEHDGSVSSTTPNELEISGLEFAVEDNIIGVAPEDRVQPRVMLKLSSEYITLKSSERRPVSIQTTVSSRRYR